MTSGKSHLKVRFKYAYKFYQNFGGAAAPDTLTIGRGSDCGNTFVPFWKKGGQQLATAGSAGSSYTPAAGDWKSVSLNLDSLLIYPEVALAFQNTFGYGNRIFIDDISIDTTDNCPSPPVVQANGDTLCTGQTLVLTMDSVANASYNWSGPGNFNSPNRISTRPVNLAAAGTYQATVTVNGCTSEQSSVGIFVVPQPAVPVITQTGDILFGPPGLNYIWLLNGDTLPDQTQSITALVSGTYTLIVRNSGGCYRSSLPKVVAVTSLSNIQENSPYFIYPNPAGNSLFLALKNGKAPESLTLVNSIGQKLNSGIFAESTGNLRIQVSNLSPGTYWLIARDGAKTIRMPFIKQ